MPIPRKSPKDTNDGKSAVETAAPKVTDVFDSEADGLASILGEAIAGKPTADPEADRIIAENSAAPAGESSPFGSAPISDVPTPAAPVDSIERDSAGNPVMKADGSGPKLKRGRKPGQQYSPAAGGSSTSVVASPQAEAAKARASAVVATNLLVTVGQFIGGDEWTPLTKAQSGGLDERENLAGAFEQYFIATGAADLPPGLALAIACGSYALPRLFLPRTKSRLQRFSDWCANKLPFFGRKKAPARVVESQPVQNGEPMPPIDAGRNGVRSHAGSGLWTDYKPERGN